MTTLIENDLDARTFRDLLSHYASGLTIIGGNVDGRLLGFTCQSFYSASVEPPLISFCVMNSSSSWPAIRKHGSFSVSVLASDQQDVSNAFARSGTDKWAGVNLTLTRAGNPVASGALIWLDCEIYNEFEAGDHSIVLGIVKEAGPRETGNSHAPLLYFKGKYCSFNSRL